jgi:pyruvate-formate lyase-activating enzyme
LLDWELTMKCNLDCSYCGTGIYGGHNNSTKHPPLDQCLNTIDFMFEYADLYMATKPKGLKYVILNVYGGESLHHPHIVEILQAVHQQYTKYKEKWHLTVTTTTNAIISPRKLLSIIPMIDEFTVSYHVENSNKNQQLFQNNILTIKQAAKRLKCVVLMHPEKEFFDQCNSMIDWLNQHQIKHLPRQLDHAVDRTEFNYHPQQVVWFNQLYSSKGNHQPIVAESELTDLADTGRACCGGRSLCTDQDYKKKTFFVYGNNFSGWSCSVNHFFLYIKQVNGEIFTNKDCKMNFDNEVAPIGHLSNTKLLLDQTRIWIESDSLPVIQCKKSRCLCGLCAPKAHSLDEYNKIFSKYFKK